MDSTISHEANGRVFPLAIVGIGCRLPGGVNDAESFWTFLAEGRSGIREVPPDRWDINRFYHPEGSVLGTMSTKWGGFVDNLDKFDASFWGITPREAMRMDPQQRWLLEVAWEALEDSGTPPSLLRRQPVGVFIGVSANDYGSLQLGNLAQADVHTMSGFALSIAANRISYLLNLSGPSVAIDTACSSALVAVWSACRNIWSGNCSSALAGGVNALILPHTSVGFSKASMLSPAGQCFAFDARANGYVRGEGAGLVYLKPLNRALADQDRIYAVIRSAVSNQDGHTPAMAVPGEDAQVDLMRQAYQEAGLAPQRVVFVEAHGTGTPVGDPIEARALGRVLGEGRLPGQPCLLGSVKTNIGHLEAGSGIAGLIKAALVLHHNSVPPNLNYATPNPHIPFTQLGLEVVTSLTPLPHQNGHAPMVAINSFGFGGSNAHVVLEQAPPRNETSVPAPRLPRTYLLPISARNNDSLRQQVEAFRALLAKPASDFAAICYSAGARREHHDERLVVLGNDASQMRRRLGAWLRGRQADGIVTGKSGASAAPVFVYTGQGAQWWAMGRNLLEQEPLFRSTVEEIDKLLQPLARWSLLEEMLRDETHSNIDRTDIAQPALFALQVGLTKLWQSWGVKPGKVIGHSVGEVAAAYAAGIYDLADAVKIVFERSRLQHTTAGLGGRMLAVGLSPAEARQTIGADADRVKIAVLNSPHQVTLAGDAQPLEEIAARMEQTGKFFRWLRIPYAFHTHQMDPIKEELLRTLDSIRPQPAGIPFMSTVTGFVLQGERLDAAYWWKNVRQQVLFGPALAQLIRSNEETFLELGPHPALASSIHEGLRDQGRTGAVFHSLRRGGDDLQELFTNLAGLHVHGAPLDWAAVNPGGNAFVKLPHYPWRRESYWLESDKTRQERLEPIVHPFLASRLPVARPTWQVDLDPRRFPFLNDHRFWDRIVFPGACYGEIGLALARLLFPNDDYAVEDLVLKKLMFLSEEQPVTVQIEFDPESKTFSIFSNASGKEAWELHAQGQLMPKVEGPRPPIDPAEVRRGLAEHRNHEAFYERADAVGYQFGPAFKQLQNVWCMQGEALGEIVIPDVLIPTLGSYHLHPAVLDACLQVTISLKAGSSKTDFYLPHSLRRVHLVCNKLPSRLWVRGRLLVNDGQSLIADLFLYDHEGLLVAQILGFRADRVVPSQSSDAPEGCYYQFHWKPQRLKSSRVQGSCFFPSASEFVAAARLIPGTELQARYYHEFAARADLIVCQAIHNAWLQLGWQPSLGKSFTTSGLIDQLDIEPAYHRFLASQVLNLAQHGWLTQVGDDSWEIARLPRQADIMAQWEELAAAYPYPEMVTEIALHQLVGPNLAAVLSGDADPVEVLFPGGSSEHIERFYVEGIDASVQAPMIRSAFTRLLENLPAQRVLRVLEIGAGTGSFTRLLLPNLPADRTEYLFSDIGPAFLATARKQFGDFPFVEYRIFDIEKDPRAQGVEPGSFDLIVGTHVLHTTKDLKSVLTNLRSCLADGGMLCFMEGFTHRIALNNIFGLLDGWWRFTDVELRQYSPHLKRAQWLTLLADCGFSDIGTFSTYPDEGRAEHGYMFGFAPATKANPVFGNVTPSPEPGSYLVFADRGGVADSLIAQLLRSGHRVVKVSVGDEFRAESDVEFFVARDSEADIGRVIASLPYSPSELAGVIHCWSLDHPRASGMSLPELWSAQETGVLSALRLVHVVFSARPPRNWFITRGVCRVQDGDCPDGLASAPLVGLLRVANNELFPSRFALIDLDRLSRADEIEQLCHEITGGDGELEIAYRGGQRYVARLDRVSLDQFPVRTVELTLNPDSSPRQGDAGKEPQVPFRLQMTRAGMLANLSLNETERRDPGPDEIEIRVRAGGINFRDVIKALGTYPVNSPDRLWFGDDVAGTVERVGSNVRHLQTGDEVVGTVPYGFRAFVTTEPWRVLKKPTQMSFEQAAALPTVFLTVYYAFHHLTRMRAGEKVLIHAGAGGVGMAAIQIAKQLGLEIFATAGSPEKRQLLLDMGAEHVMNSRTLEFADQVMEITQGKGVDVVLNSLEGDFIPKSLSVLAVGGRFLEIGKADVYKNTRLGLELLKNNISYHVIDMAQFFERHTPLVASLIREFSEKLHAGAYHPLPVNVFPITGAAEAFRYMAQGKHVGKNVLTFDVPSVRIGPCTEDAQRFRADATYLITGGTSGFGLEIAKWLSKHGARNLVLLSRSGPRDEAAGRDVEHLRAAGINVVDARGDVARLDDVNRIVERIRLEMPPLKGVIHCAMVLLDDLMVSLDEEHFLTPLSPKMAGAWNLHTATSQASLEHFICFSSFSSVLGIPKQSHYNAGNYFLDALAQYRHSLGLPALTVNWGALLGAGFVDRNRQIADALQKMDSRPFSLDEALAIFGQLTLLDPVQIAATHLNWQLLPKLCPRIDQPGTYAALGRENPEADKGGSLRSRFQNANAGARTALLEDFVAAQVAGVFGIGAEKIDRAASITQLGLDSLMAVELANRLQREVATTIPRKSFLGDASIKSLAQTMVGLMEQTGAARQEASPETTASASPADAAESAIGNDPHFRILLAGEAERVRADLRCEGASLVYLPEKFSTVGRLNDGQLAAMFGSEPFVSAHYETSLGRIAVVMLPSRSQALFHQDQGRETIVRAVELAGRCGARFVSLTGLIPSFTQYGQDVADWVRGRPDCPPITTGHATTTAAVIRNLEQMLKTVGRSLEHEALAVLGLGSIGQSCLRLLLEVCPHPRDLILCDMFSKEEAWHEFAAILRTEHGYRGPMRLVSSRTGAPAEVYEASTILTAVSVPDVLEVDRLRPWTLVVDDSYPPAFPVEAAMRRLESEADILFSNAGMLRLADPIRETLLVPAGAEGPLAQFGVAAFREEALRDAHDLTACILSSLLTGLPGGAFPPTLGLAEVADLICHYRELDMLNIGPSRPQCDKYIIPETAVERFREGFGGKTFASDWK